MKKFLLAPFLAALAMFFWGFLYYGLSGIPYKTLGTAGDVGPALSQLFPADGTYLVPDPRGTPEVMAEQTKRGLFATVHIKKSGVTDMDPAMLGKGFVLEFVSCLLLAVLLSMSNFNQNTYACRLILCVLVGTLATLFANGGQAIWWLQQWGWHLMTMLHDIVAFTLAGTVLAFFHKPKAA